MELLLLFGWLGLSIAIGAFASGRGRSGGGWFLLACLLSPLVAGVLLAAAGAKAAPRRQCPSCAEPILPAAALCPHCRSAVPAVPPASAPGLPAGVLAAALGVIAAAFALALALEWGGTAPLVADDGGKDRARVAPERRPTVIPQSIREKYGL